MCKLFGNAAKNIVFNWSVTQGLGFKQQLCAGIRYLDLRVAEEKDIEPNDLYFTHGLLGGKIQPGLQEIASFLEEHKQEVVILDFNHFYKMNKTTHEQLYQLIVQTFGSKLCPFISPSEWQDKLTLSNLWQNNKQVIAFYQSDSAKEHGELWPQLAIRSPWPNTCDLSKMISYLEENYRTRHQMPSPTNMFYVCQGVLTPDFPYMVSHFMGNLKTDLAEKVG